MCKMFLGEVELSRGTKSRVCFCCFVEQLVLRLCKHSVKGGNGSWMEMTHTELSCSMDPGAVEALVSLAFVFGTGS